MSQIKIRCRAIISHEGKTLFVRHMRSTGKPADFLSLPGGHLDFGEDPQECIERELIEELGVRPHIGRLLFVHTFTSEESETVEFFFEVLNGEEFVHHMDKEKTHAHEISEVVWASSDDNVRILPETFAKLFQGGEVYADVARFIRE